MGMNSERLCSPHLKRLEAESIRIIREAVAEAQNPVMLYSIGKDSSVMLHLARKAFYPGYLHCLFCTWTRVGNSKPCTNSGIAWPRNAACPC